MVLSAVPADEPMQNILLLAAKCISIPVPRLERPGFGSVIFRFGARSFFKTKIRNGFNPFLITSVIIIFPVPKIYILILCIHPRPFG